MMENDHYYDFYVSNAALCFDLGTSVGKMVIRQYSVVDIVVVAVVVVVVDDDYDDVAVAVVALLWDCNWAVASHAL